MSSSKDKQKWDVKRELNHFFGFAPPKFVAWMISSAVIISMQTFFFACRFGGTSICFYIEDIFYNIYSAFADPLFDFSLWLNEATGLYLVFTEVLFLFVFIYLIVSVLFYLLWKLKERNVSQRNIVVWLVAALIFLILFVIEAKASYGLTDYDLSNNEMLVKMNTTSVHDIEILFVPVIEENNEYDFTFFSDNILRQVDFMNTLYPLPDEGVTIKISSNVLEIENVPTTPATFQTTF